MEPIDMNELLSEIYDTLRKYKIISSGNEFSREYLGRSDRLYSYIHSSGNEPNLSVMIGLYHRLDEMLSKSMKNKEHMNATIFEDLADRLWDAIKDESLRKGPHRRKKQSDDDARTVSG